MAIGQYKEPFTDNGDVHVRLQMCENLSSWTPPSPQQTNNII